MVTTETNTTMQPHVEFNKRECSVLDSYGRVEQTLNQQSLALDFFLRLSFYTANVFAVKVTGFPCVTLEPCKVHVIITGKTFQLISL